MFPGFDTTNNPILQVHDFSKVTGNRAALTNDCAPSQVILMDSSFTGTVNLPSGCIVGKTIKFKLIGNSATAPTGLITFTAGSTALELFIGGCGSAVEFMYVGNVTKSANVLASGWVIFDSKNGLGDQTGYGDYTTISGGRSTKASGQYAAVCGGDANNATGNNSFVGSGSANAASGNLSAICGGADNQSGGYSAAVGGGNVCYANANYATTSGGQSNNASGVASSIGGGSNNTSAGENATIPGGAYARTQGIYGKYAHASGQFGTGGDAQRGSLIIRRATTDATATVLSSDGSTPGTTNQLSLQNNQAMVVRGQVIARRNIAGANEAIAWEFTCVIRRGANAAATALVAAATTTLIAADSAISTASFTATADTTNGCLKIEVTGIAAITLRWLCTLTTTEVIAGS